MSNIVSQMMEVIDYNDNRGLIPIKLGEARIINGNSRLLHLINLTQYDQNILDLNLNIHQIQEKTKLDTHLATLYHNKISILILQLDKLEDTLNSLKPTYRSKRGLINGLGSIFKSITGNLDNDDYVEINQAIQQLYRVTETKCY